MVQYRKDLLANNEYYHIFSRSIAKYIIFNNEQEYSRILDLINVLHYKNFDYQYSQFSRMDIDKQNRIIIKLKIQNNTFVDIIAYCIMPTHIHLILKQNIDGGITKYIGKVLNSYSKYFNTKHNRTGPLWSARFKNILINDDEQLLHLTRYIHLNPCSAELVDAPENWNYSSYNEFLDKTQYKICNYKNILNINPDEYKKFIDDRKNFQQQLSQIKHLLIENYSD